MRNDGPPDLDELLKKFFDGLTGRNYPTP
jgi:hypothetical protein